MDEFYIGKIHIGTPQIGGMIRPVFALFPKTGNL
jgi:hypothetical protein